MLLLCTRANNASYLLPAAGNRVDGLPRVLELHQHHTKLRLASHAHAIGSRYQRATTASATATANPASAIATNATPGVVVVIVVSVVVRILLLVVLEEERKYRALGGAGNH